MPRNDKLLKIKKLIVLSAPSGAGKTTIVRYLLENFKNLSFSISATSRQKREGEIEGKDYYFLSKEKFRDKINNNEFLEWEEVYKDNFYGTLLSEIHRIWKENKSIIFDIDVKGALNIKKQFPKDTITIFISPPSLEELENRLRNRATEMEENIIKRISKAKEEMSYKDKFDKVIINDDLEKAKNKALKIISHLHNY